MSTTKFKGKDEVGNKYNRLTVISYSHSIRANGHFWNCLCDCGTQTVVLGAALRNSHTKSCGCLNLEVDRTTHGKTGTPIYVVWYNMIQRCRNEKNTKYKDYGGRGITYDPNWNKFENFYEDMGDRPEGMELDRINVDGNYCKENCRWVDKSLQIYNQRYETDTISGVIGVYPSGSKWEARITFNKETIKLGSFFTVEEAIKARREAELEYYGFNR